MSTRNCTCNPCTCKLRVLVVDNDPADRADHVWSLTEWGYIPIVAEGGGRPLLEDAKRKAKEHRCHAAIVDMRLFDDHDIGDQSGLDLLPDLQPAKCVVVTGYGTVPSSRKANEHGAAMVGKAEGSKAVRTELIKSLNDLCRDHFIVQPNGWLEKHIVPYLKASGHQPVAAGEVLDLLAILFPDTQRLHLSNLAGAVPSSLPRMSLLRRSSVVIRVKPDRMSYFVVKFTTPSRIVRERTNYEAFVKDRIQGRRYAQVSRHKRLWNVGGIAYSVLGEENNQGEISLLRNYYAKHGVDAIIQALKDFFTALWHPLYQEKKPLSDSLFASYNHLWGHLAPGGKAVSPDQMLVRPFDEKFADWAKKDRFRTFEHLTGSYPDPRRWLVEHHEESALPATKQCIIHGDLHGDNLFVDENRKTWIIDYERTGYGHSLADCVELEHDILTRLAEISDLRIFYSLSINLTTPRRPQDPAPDLELDSNHPEYSTVDKAWKVICGLRKLALQVCEYEDQREYYWALLLDTLFSIHRLEEQPEAQHDQITHQKLQKTLLLASILCRRLEEWGQEWPPKDWPTLQSILDQPSSRAGPVPGPKPGQPSRQSKNTGFTRGYALLIGVGGTPNVPHWSLPVTAKDATDLAALLGDPGRCAYPPHQIKLLCNTEANRETIAAELKQLAGQIAQEKNATAFIFFSGHGIWNPGDGRYGFLPSNVTVDPYGFPSPDTILWARDFMDLLDSIQPQRMVVALDVCHAQGFTKAQDEFLPHGFVKAPPPPGFLSMLHQGQGRAILSSCLSKQKSYILPDGSNSIFTFYLLEALRGSNNHAGDQEVRISNLINHVGKYVPMRLVAEYPTQELEQTPYTQQASTDFPIALLLGGKGLA